MNRRTIAIINDKEKNIKNVSGTISMLMSNNVADKVVVYTKFAPEQFNINSDHCACSGESIPSECDNEPKIRNWINSKYGSECGFLHVISDGVEILKDPAHFMSDIENMMTALDYTVWFSTVTDGCNYVYQKYNPRIRVQCDRLECARLSIGGELDFTSHSNTQWIAYDMSKTAGTDLMRFDERFTISMFFIIEFLARRRNTKNPGQLFYMNQYLTVGSEVGAFRNFKSETPDNPPDPIIMKKEDDIFKSMNINFAPDNNVDQVLEQLWEKISQKSSM
jgi:hypothetical protein